VKRRTTCRHHGRAPVAGNVKRHKTTMHQLDKADLLALLAKVIDEEHWCLDAHQSRVHFYTSFISAIIVATIAGTLNAKEAHHYLLLLIGPLLIWAVAQIAEDGTYRLYQRFLEAVTMRAKLEQVLGLTNPFPSLPPGAYWGTEPLIPDRYLRSRQEAQSSADLISTSRGKGSDAATLRLLLVVRAIALTLFGALCVISIVVWLR